MKKKLILLFITFGFGSTVLFAQTKPKPKSGKGKKTISKTEEGRLLISKSDCLSCHRPTIKLIGPSFHDVAVKYPANPENNKMLKEKIIKGGSGNWGEVPMSPHSNLSNTDAEKMVAYILNFK